MKSYIEIGSICIDLPTFANDDKNDPGKCDHFTIRGYVSEVRKKNWKTGWPFPVNESEEPPSFPPMDEPKFKSSILCLKCLQKNATEVIPGNDKIGVSCGNGCNAVFSSGIQQVPVPNSTPVTEEIDLNKPVDPSCGTDCLPFINEIENNADVVHNEMTDHDIGLENNPNHHLSSIPQPEVYPGVINEGNTNSIGGNVVVVSNVNVATEEEGDITDHTSGLLPPEPMAVNHVVPVRGIEKTAENGFQNHNAEKSSGLTRKRPRKTRLLSELVKEIGEPKTDSATTKGSSSHCASNPSAAAYTVLVLPDNADVQGDMTLSNNGQLRKRKFLVDEDSRPGNIEVQNHAGGSKNINTIGKKHKNVYHVDNNLMPRPPQGQWRESEGTVDVANKEAPSKSLPSCFFPHVSTERRMEGFPSNLLRKKNDCNSKGKQKLIQADELDSLFSGKNEQPVEVSAAHTGVKNVSNMPLSTAVPSEKGTPNGELVEGMYPSSKCYSSELICNKQSIQTEIKLPFALHFQEGTSRPLPIRKDNKTNFFRVEKIPSNHMSNAISVNGEGVHLDAIKVGGNKDKTAETIVLDSPERYLDPTAEEFEHGSLDDATREVVEIMARNQYERSLPDVENISGLLEKSTQRGKHQARYGERREENMSLRKGNSITHFSPLQGKQFGTNNLRAISYPCGLEDSTSKNKTSSGVNFSSIGTRQHGPAQPSKFNRNIAECGTSGTTLQTNGRSNLCKTVLQQDGVAALPWAPLTKKVVSMGFDYLPENANSQPSSSNIDLNSPWSNSLHMQNNKWDIDLNSPNCNVIDLEKLPRTIGSGDMSTMNAEYSFSGKNNRMEPHRNQMETLDSDSNEALQAMQTLRLMGAAGRQSATSSNVGFNAGMINRPSYAGESSTSLEKIASKTHGSPRKWLSYDLSGSSSSDILGDPFRKHQFLGTSSSVQHGEKYRNPPDFRDPYLAMCGKGEKRNSSNSMMQNSVIMQFERPNLETHNPQQHRLDVSEPLLNNPQCSTMLNRNPAEFTLPDEDSPYMIRGEDLKFDDSILEGRPALRSPRGHMKKNAKPSQMKFT